MDSKQPLTIDRKITEIKIIIEEPELVSGNQPTEYTNIKVSIKACFKHRGKCS